MAIESLISFLFCKFVVNIFLQAIIIFSVFIPYLSYWIQNIQKLYQHATTQWNWVRCKWFRAHQLFEPIILHWSTTVSMICKIKICNTIFFFKCKIKSTEMLAHRALNHWHSYNVALYLQNLGKLWTIFGSPIYTITR